MRWSTNLIDTFVPGKVQVDILAIFAVFERVNIWLGKNSFRESMEECIASLVEVICLGEWGSKAGWAG